MSLTPQEALPPKTVALPQEPGVPMGDGAAIGARPGQDREVVAPAPKKSPKVVAAAVPDPMPSEETGPYPSNRVV